jgi:hypothetical protein
MPTPAQAAVVAAHPAGSDGGLTDTTALADLSIINMAPCE